MPRRPTIAQGAALRALTQQLEGIQRQFAEEDRQRERPRTASTRPAPVAELSLDDWDALLGAVSSRLRLTADESLIPRLDVAAVPWQASVLECVEALDQLRLTLSHAVTVQAQIAWHEPDAPSLPTFDALPQRLDLDRSPTGTALPATHALGPDSRDPSVPQRARRHTAD